MDLPVGEKLGKAFEAAYPGIAVQIERSGSERLFQRIDQEFATNIRAADIDQQLRCLALHPLEEERLADAVRARRCREIFSGSYRDADGMSATTADLWLSSIAYNTNLVKAEDAPKSFADLLDPKWAGKMVKGHPAYSGTIMTATFQMVRELGWEYLEKLAKQRVMQVQSSTDPPKKLSLGERAVMADGNEYGIVLLKEAGQPVEPVYPAEGTPTISGPTGIFASAPHPNAARLFQAWLHTPRDPAILRRLHRAVFGACAGAVEAGTAEDFRHQADEGGCRPAWRRWRKRSRRAMRGCFGCDLCASATHAVIPGCVRTAQTQMRMRIDLEIPGSMLTHRPGMTKERSDMTLTTTIDCTQSQNRLDQAGAVAVRGVS